MNIFAQFSTWQQVGLFYALLIPILLIWGLHMLRQLLQRQADTERERELRLQLLEERLREQERSILREQAELRDQLSEKILRGALAQQRTLQGLQQILLERSDRLYQALERRFGEMQQHLTEDAGKLRVELLTQFESLQKGVTDNLSQGRLTQPIIKEVPPLGRLIS